MFYGIQSLLSLIDGSTDRKLPKTEISDKPRFQFRGMHLDVARNFNNKETVMKLLDVMAMYKMNKLHFHLTDDEGWRVEIAGLPELTSIASKRCHDLKDETCLISQLGSGPDNSTSGSGFYTRDEYIDIVKYAAGRHIEVIPEIDTPGHARAAIKAMEARFKRLSDAGQPNPSEHRLIDPSDTSAYSSVQMFNDNAVNPCIESTYNFISAVIDDLKTMHAAAGQPLRVFHFGGDEVANGAWENSSACIALNFSSSLTGREKYKLYFVQRVADLTNQKGLKLGGWEDGLMDANKNPYAINTLATSEVIANPWDNVWEWGVAKRAYALANAGYKLVLSHATHLYFDHPYEPDPEERGLYWATRFTDTFKSFGYNADDLYKNIDVRRSGQPITKPEVCTSDNSGCPPLNKPENIIGMQGHLWSETVLSKENFDYMIFPRILSVAERAWHKASWETVEDKESRENQINQDWELFANTIGYKEMKRLENMGVNSRLAPPGAKLMNHKLTVNTEFPGMQIEYSKDNGLTWKNIPEQYEPNDNFLLRSKSPNGLRVSRLTKFTLTTDQLLLNYIADHLEVRVDIVDNLNDNGQTFTQKIRIKNLGTKPIRSGTWSIYLDIIRLVEPSHYPYPDGYLIQGSGMRIFHIGGSLYKLHPDPDTYRSILPNKEIVLEFRSKYWQSARTDIMPNWYIAAEGLQSQIIQNTEGESLNFVGPFDTVNKWKRFPNDKFNPYTPSARYAINGIVPDLKLPGKHLLPTPYLMTLDESSKVTISRGYWVVLDSAEFQNEIKYLTDKLHLVKVSTKPLSRYITFVKNTVLIDGQPSSSTEAYKLVIDPIKNVVTITANHSEGAFFGIQSMLRLSSKIGNGIELPKAEITDKPRFGYRGMHLDVSRNFHTVEDVKLLLNAMAAYKLNKFHFHLTDDEGWRLEIPGLPELTGVGSKRCDDLKEETCTLSQLGSGPTSGSSGSGYFTISQYQYILREAKRLHIEVIPEFDMPGHARAAIKSMEKRYNYYKNNGNMTKANEFLLAEINDPSKYLTVQFFNDNAVNPCLESTYNFIGYIMKKVKEMHQAIQPLSMYHFGGDEVAGGAWLKSSACLKLMNETFGLKNGADLKEYFAKRVALIAQQEGLDVGSWEDGVMRTLTEPFDVNTLVTPPRKVFTYSWNNIFEWGSGDHAYIQANAGYKVILGHATHLYFDHPYEPDPEERGYYWATRFTDTFKTFSFVPGIQGHLWSETVRTSEQMQYMIFPRMLALAERAWHKSDWEDIQNKVERNAKMTEEWKQFANTLGYKDLGILDDMGIKYRVPPPGAK
ncbi:hypothetical protein KUTeg_000882 [Tegillarca granosa]|uniref:beta-N-acetylhexosaminidase n=1 Tax=Tegillarca granosa TaxID=220873 RepID=A0ABQ9FZU4_TEGGR|nr:hypothetical protein KUTeg_000882 [Tegillarca granosa]